MITHLCWNRGEPDVRVLQLGFTTLVLAVLGLRVLGGRTVELVSWPVAGVVLSTAAALAVIVGPQVAGNRVATRGMAVLNIAALGMLAGGADLGGASPLVVLPALWLGLDLGLLGGAFAVGATLVCITIPGVIAHGLDAATVERLAILPVVVGVGAAAITAGVTAARAAQARAEAREADLQAAMEVIERNRRSSDAIFEAVDIGLAMLDRDGEPLLINHRLAEFSEIAYPGGAADGGWVFDESGTTRMGLDDAPTSRARRGEEFDDVRVWIGRDEKTRRAMSVSARRVEDPDGSMWGAAVSYADVTDLMRALQVKDEFVALVSHELRTPLTSIIGYAAVILERSDLTPELRRHLEVVARNAQRLHRLVGDLLDEAQHTGHPVPLEERDTDLATIVRDCVLAAQPHADRAGIELELSVPASLELSGDPQRLTQVVDHLVSNAIKYTGPGGRAHVRAALEQGRAVIRVRDTGIGISPEDHCHLFTRFFRTREARLRAIQGVGLGLSIAKTIVESHGGVIEVESEVGSGSEFRVVLPLRE